MGLRSVILVVVVVALGAVACSSEPLDDATPERGVTRVRLEGNEFGPRVIEVTAGTEVTWSWDDGSRKHDVEGDGFKSPVQSDGEFPHVFEAPGTYDYVCNLHPNMDGRVVVIGE